MKGVSDPKNVVIFVKNIMFGYITYTFMRTYNL